MDWMLFWSAFGAIGGTLGAIATVAAVSVALWQTKYSERKKLRLKFSDSIVMADIAPSNHEEMLVSLSIVNIGNRNVIIQNWGFVYHKKKSHALIGLNPSYLMQIISPRLPYELTIENKVDLYIEKHFFVESLKEGIKKKELKERKKLILFAIDSTGKEYKVKSEKTIKEMLK